MAIYENYSTAAPHTLITKDGPLGGAIKKISISNNSANSSTIDLYLDDGSTQYYFCKNVTVPSGVTLIVDDNLGFDKSKYNLKITNAGTSPNITVIIK